MTISKHVKRKLKLACEKLKTLCNFTYTLYIKMVVLMQLNGYKKLITCLHIIILMKFTQDYC